MKQPAIVELVRHDPRYSYYTYEFVLAALSDLQKARDRLEDHGSCNDHVDCLDLLHAIIDYARREFGYLARVVFRQWGIHTTGDIGEVVFNLIESNILCKTESDHRASFQDVYDLDRILSESVAIDYDEDALSRREVL